MSDDKGLNADQIQVITITGVGLALTGLLFAIGLLANYWNTQADQTNLDNRPEIHINSH